MKKIVGALLSSLIFYPNIGYSHEGGFGGGFGAGLAHPVLGFDHLLAMLSVGILSAQIGGNTIWTIPLAFVSFMLMGGILGINEVALVSVELGIAFSVLILGVALAADKKIPVIITIFFVGIFAIFHGHAHGTEMPFLAEPQLYAVGFIIGTAGIHIIGVLIGISASKIKQGWQLLRYIGASIAGIGFHLIIS
ncbi:HupE/UreJ family protein [Endozoicomonas sp. SM1973]|uniref:HupE/UreJ family protein n=1 Tax=Spartinivicinus marinus TaxID=2994442 RepID=A0A853IEY2_9GAMM|nr:HupE/UreJ family protein [Spartinivicinus marinus]MCX4027737.1 HupE/UreJ family protein [Spartinivicinus marinus]NYZ68541.1 HupE/UreJ family protein [Spartinivicinus marinus]